MEQVRAETKSWRRSLPGSFFFAKSGKRLRALRSPAAPKNFSNRGRAMRHRHSVFAITQLEVAAAEKMVRLDRGRPAKCATHDAHPARRPSRLQTLEISVASAENREGVFAVGGHDLQRVSGFELG